MATDSVTNIDQGFPTIQAPLVNHDRTINQIWLQLFITLWNRTGMGRGVSSADAVAFATLSQNPLSLPLPDVDTDVAVASALSVAIGGNQQGQGLDALQFDVLVPTRTSDELASALFFPTPPQSSGAAAGAVIVKDEGVVLTIAVTSLDFVGAAITATAVGSAVTVTSNGMLPLVNGDLPGPSLIADASGQCIGVPL